MILWRDSRPAVRPKQVLGSGRTKLCFIELNLDTVGNLNVKSISAQHKMLTVQPLASTTSPLSPTLTLLSVYLRAGPVFSVKGTFNVSFSHICELCCVTSPHIIMCLYSASTQNVTLPADCWRFCCGGTMLVTTSQPGGLCCSTFVPCTPLYRVTWISVPS